MPRRPRVPLAPVRRLEETRRLVRRSLGVTPQVEVTKAETMDGTWRMVRGEATGSEWRLYHQPSTAGGSHPGPVMTCGTLKACQAAIADGTADQALAHRKETKEADR